ncbi:protoporphyrinogen oxidase [Desulfobaculum xiamenense]|uniref:Protoporphyrinogen oxidase n=1 Tax=Desulfobaculum xiamenense TaxID=995050 RepID=A0A846QQQ7_9BACT|nr:NAD(P)-binding protein [Desulfobaculum xiamenense]NJB68693.1 protoporphyrinogen oxidase [Desulfobaculum xiamenense]
MRVAYAILGAGPSGLAFANALRLAGEESFVVLEREAEPGGLCRSHEVDGAPLDIGGGHFLDVRDREVLDFLFAFMPEDEWTRHVRRSTIRYHGREMGYPFEANLWRLPVDEQLEFLVSVAEAGCNRGLPRPEGFVEWIVWKLGRRIADEYMLAYNAKLWGDDLDRLGTYWMDKLPDVSLRDTLQSCLERRPAGRIPAHGEFYYPRVGGYGELWRRMGRALGDRLLLSTPVESVDAQRRVINGVIEAGCIVSSIPWPQWTAFTGIPGEVRASMRALGHVGIRVDYSPAQPKSDAHWVYVPDRDVPHHRELNRCNFLPGSRGGWTETNAARGGDVGVFSHVNEYAYPLNTVDKPAHMRRILEWAASRAIHGLGRWGLWEHMNSDVAVARGMALARELCPNEADATCG